eukprot:scaffold3849_cov83-Skeletonema_marinoi.AAC.1
MTAVSDQNYVDNGRILGDELSIEHQSTREQVRLMCRCCKIKKCSCVLLQHCRGFWPKKEEGEMRDRKENEKDN